MKDFDIDFGLNKNIHGFRKKDIASPKIGDIYITKVGHRGITQTQKAEVKKRAKYRCEKCGKKKDSEDLEVDHKIAIHKYSKGKVMDEVTAKINYGMRREKMLYDKIDNYQALCKKCHNAKNKEEAGERAKKRKLNSILD
ncbi:MAG: HNH endonuclease signature motif containing protein [Nanoarchaeota archaeon]|nr:HNH endonuclease signature motif containing protein [Nanoarchaeota archaeon]